MKEDAATPPPSSLWRESPCRSLVKKFIALLLAGAAVLSVSACSNTSDTSDELELDAGELAELAAEQDSPELEALIPVVWEWTKKVNTEAQMLAEMGTYEGTYATEVIDKGEEYNATVAYEGAIGWVQSQGNYGDVTKESITQNYDDITAQYEEIKEMPGEGTAVEGLREEADITYKAYSEMYKAVTKPTETNSSTVLENQALVSGSVPIIASVCGETLE